MPTPRRTHPPEFRQQLVEHVWAGRIPEELSRAFEPSAQTIRNWVHQAERDGGQRSDGLPTPEREELTRLKRENRQLKLGREILAKATAWFARETGTIPPSGSGS
jgi:transposase